MARIKDLRAEFGRGEVERAVASGELVRIARTFVGLAGQEDGIARAAGAGVVVAGPSAAMLHGWRVLRDPERLTVILEPGSKLRGGSTQGMDVWRSRLDAWEVAAGRTAPLRTVMDCARRLEFPDALAIADSALRSGAVSARELDDAVAAARGPGGRGLRSVAAHASPLAANPFESAVRAQAIMAGGDFVPQGELVLPDGVVLHPDLVCAAHRIVIECDSFTFHSQRSQIRHDCWRYTTLVNVGWVVLRFAWEHAMFQADWVREQIALALSRARAV